MSAVPHSTPYSQQPVADSMSPVGSPTSDRMDESPEDLMRTEVLRPRDSEASQPRQLRISLPGPLLMKETEAMMAMEYKRAASSPRLAALSPRRHSLIT